MSGKEKLLPLSPTGEDANKLLSALNGTDENGPFKPLLQNFDVLSSTTDEGGILMQSKITGHNIHVHGGGVDGDMSSAQMQTPEGMKAQLELALMAKAMPNAANGMAFHAGDEISQLIGEKAAQLVGLKILDPSEKTLDPGLAKQLDEAWASLKQEHPELAQLGPSATQEYKAPGGPAMASPAQTQQWTVG